MKTSSWTVLLTSLILLSGCGVEMEDVKKELLPRIERNASIVEKIQKNQDVNFTKISDNVLYMEKDISKIRDRIKSLQLFVEREVAEQNEYLAKIADIEYNNLEKETKYLENRLIEIKKMMNLVKAKKKKADKRVADKELTSAKVEVKKVEKEKPKKVVAPVNIKSLENSTNKK